MAMTVLILNTSNLCAQRLKAGPQDLSFFSTVDETDQPYAVYIPKNFDESRKYPFESSTPRFEYVEYPGINHNSWEWALPAL
jgi:hypothetical protein